MEILGIMSEAEINRVVETIEATKKNSRDYIWPAAMIGATADAGISLLLASRGHLFAVKSEDPFAATPYFADWHDAEAYADKSGGKIVPETGSAAIPISPKALTQLADTAGLPIKYLRYLEEKGQQELAAHNIVELLKRNKGKLLIRTINGERGLTARAVLSNRYRMIDNHDLFLRSAEAFKGAGADLWKARTWGDGTGFEMFAVAPHIRGSVRTDRPFQTGSGWSARWKGQDGDVQNAAVTIRNSETGHGGLHISMAIMTLVCLNFHIAGKGISVVHLERPKNDEGLVRSQELMASEDKTLSLKLRDTIKTAFDPAAFSAYIDHLNGLTQEAIPQDRQIERVTNVLQKTALSEVVIRDVVAELLKSRDLSRYGLVQATTQQAHSFDKAGKQAAASEAEAAGSFIAAMKPTEFKQLLNA